MNYGYAFSFQFKDNEWIKKFALAALFTLIPIVGQLFLAGWGLEITRRVIKEDPEPLPDWNDFGTYIVKGIQLVIVGLVYALPIILVQACTQGATVLGSEEFYGEDAFVAVSIVIQTCMGCLTFLYSIFIGLFVPAAIGHFAAEGQLGAAFRFGEIFRVLKAEPGAYMIILLASFVMPFIALLGLVFCLVGVLFTFPYVLTVMQYLYGEAYRVSKAGLDAGIDSDLNPDAQMIADA